MKRHSQAIDFFSVTEILIGTLQCVPVLVNFFESGTLSAPNFLLLAAGFLSVSLGIGLLCRNRFAVGALIVFSSGVILSKLCVFTGCLKLPPEARILMPKAIENLLSLFYHGGLIVFLTDYLKMKKPNAV